MERLRMNLSRHLAVVWMPVPQQRVVKDHDVPNVPRFQICAALRVERSFEVLISMVARSWSKPVL